MSKFTPSKRGKQPSISTAPSETTTTTEDDETEDSTTGTSPVDDGLPHPRVSPLPPHLPLPQKLTLPKKQPFESRRDFYQRTSNEWQEILMTSLRWKNIQPETLSVKEIKARAFELAEEKWWDCREEITALEDEQEAAGIGEVVSLADREGGSGAGAGGGGAGRRR